MRAPPPLFARLPEQFFVRIVGRARREAAAAGVPLIDLGRGNPDLPPPPSVREALAAAALEPAVEIHGYPPFAGDPALREALAARYAADHGVEIDPEREIAIVPGSKTGIMLVAQAALGPGDVALTPDPGYPDYRSGIALAGAEAVALPLEPPGWQPAWDAVGEAVRERLGLIYLNYPSNPCATLAAPGTLEQAVALAQETGALLVHDIAYGFLAFDGARSRSVLEVAGAREVAVELWSASKVYGMAGWRVGAVVGCAEAVARVQELLDHVLAGVPLAIQRALTLALTSPQEHVTERAAVYAARRDRLVAALAGADVAAPEGSFYAWWRLPDGLTPASLLAGHRVAVAPGEGFGERGRGYARLSLALADDALDEGLARLATALS